MMADKESKNKGIGEYAAEIRKFQGFMGFYKGYNTNVMRAMVNNATQMGCYDIIKTWMINMFALEGLLLQFFASFCAGFFVTCTVAPFDKCRTLLMNQPADVAEDKKLRGLGDAFLDIFKKEGPLGFYKGFIPMWTRLAPSTCL